MAGVGLGLQGTAEEQPVVDVRLDDVTVEYPGERGDERVAALDRLTLHVASGELLTLVGPSGSGKSTVLRTVAGLETPRHGEVVIDGTVVTALAPRERDVALVTQYHTLLPHLTVEENLGFPLRLRKIAPDEADRRVRAEARSLGLWSKLRRRPAQLSTGERQKASLGRATTRRPRVYLFDEPLAGLDLAERSRLRRELRQLQRGMGVTSIYVTHDQRDAIALGDRLAVMAGGRVVQTGPPLEVYRDPGTLFVVRFLGAPSWGVVEGPLRDDGTTAWIDMQGTAVRLHPVQRGAVHDAAAGPDVALGVPAGSVRLHDDGAADGPWLRQVELRVRTVEPVGGTLAVGLRAASAATDHPSQLYGMVPQTARPSRGELVTATIDLRDSYLFDARSGVRILPRRS